MKILIPSLDTIHTRNIGACLKSCDFMQTAIWDVSRKSLIDAFDEINPDVVFLHENQLDQSFDIVAKQDNFKYFLICSSMPSRISKAPSAVITGSQFLHNFRFCSLLYCKIINCLSWCNPLYCQYVSPTP